MQTDLVEMVYSQPPTPVATDNTEENSIMNGTGKQKRYRAIDIIFYWLRERIQQNYFRIFWEEGNKTPADCVTKHHLIWYHRTMQPRYLKPTKKTYKNKNTGELEPK